MGRNATFGTSPVIQNDASETKAAPERPRSLEHFIRDPSTKSGALIEDLRKGVIPLSAQEIDRAREAIRDSNFAALRIAELLRASKRAPNSVRVAIVDLADWTIKQDVADWGSGDLITPIEKLAAVADWARGPLSGKDKVQKIKAEGLLAIAVSFCGDDRRLEPLRTIEVVGSAYGVKAGESETDQRPSRAVLKLIERSKPRQIATLASVALLQQGALARAHADADRAVLRAAHLEGRLAKSATEVERLQEEIATQTLKIDAYEQRVVELEQKLVNVERNGAHDLNEIKSRYRRIFNSDILPVAKDALSSLELIPPQPDFATDYLAIVIDKIGKELQWLNAS